MDGLINLQINQAINKDFQPNVASSKVVKSDADAISAGQEFEAVFLTQMVEQMFTGLESDTMFGGGQAESIYRSMLAKEYADSMSERGGLGIAKMITKEILSLQEEANK